MNWTSFSDFVAMGGYSQYVWGAYLVSFGIIVAELALLRVRRKRALEAIARLRDKGKGETDETTS